MILKIYVQKAIMSFLQRRYVDNQWAIWDTSLVDHWLLLADSSLDMKIQLIKSIFERKIVIKRCFSFQSPDMAAWQNDYLQGTGCEMYTETLSHSFAGMTFAQAAE